MDCRYTQGHHAMSKSLLWPLAAIIITALAIVICLAQSAQAWSTEYDYVLPPIEYDHPYSGQVYYQRAENPADIREKCRIPPSSDLKPYACAFREAGWCVIWLLPDEQLAIAAWPKDVILRHEIGHCNGWHGHAGARLWQRPAAPVAKGDRDPLRIR